MLTYRYSLLLESRGRGIEVAIDGYFKIL